jgi:hypothetical protein
LNPPPSFTVAAPARMMGSPAEKLTCCRKVNANTINIMGDRSPKSNQKKSNQKQTKADNADQNKKQALAAKQSVNKKN